LLAVAGLQIVWVCAQDLQLIRADTLRPLEPPGAYKEVPRRVRGLDGQIRDVS
jgi:hypothetical protein